VITTPLSMKPPPWSVESAGAAGDKWTVNHLTIRPYKLKGLIINSFSLGYDPVNIYSSTKLYLVFLAVPVCITLKIV